MSNDPAPVLFLSHGGGPLPLLNDPGHSEMLAAFQEIKSAIKKPSSIVVISAHWEANEFSVGNGEYPGMYYDYGGFPAESYAIEYPAPGNSQLAEKIAERLGSANLSVSKSPKRDYDHGVFVPLKLLFPEADIPIVTVSLRRGLDPAEHIAMGQCLAGLRDENVMIIGSGMSFHNMQLLFNPHNTVTQQASKTFTDWLDNTLELDDVSQTLEQLTHWENAPAARMSHPREEHLIPIHVCYGAAQNAVKTVYKFSIMDVPSRCYLWSK